MRAAMLLLLLLSSAAGALAQQPSYLVLRPYPSQTRSEQHDPTREKWRPAEGIYVARTPYAYGYFGASPSSKWYRSTNYSGRYTQWQRR